MQRETTPFALLLGGLLLGLLLLRLAR